MNALEQQTAIVLRNRTLLSSHQKRSDPLPGTKSHDKFPVELLEKAIELRSEGFSWRQIGRTFGVSYNGIRDAVKRYQTKEFL